MDGGEVSLTEICEGSARGSKAEMDNRLIVCLSNDRVHIGISGDPFSVSGPAMIPRGCEAWLRGKD